METGLVLEEIVVHSEYWPQNLSFTRILRHAIRLLQIRKDPAS